MQVERQVKSLRALLASDELTDSEDEEAQNKEGSGQQGRLERIHERLRDSGENTIRQSVASTEGSIFGTQVMKSTDSLIPTVMPSPSRQSVASKRAAKILLPPLTEVLNTGAPKSRVSCVQVAIAEEKEKDLFRIDTETRRLQVKGDYTGAVASALEGIEAVGYLYGDKSQGMDFYKWSLAHGCSKLALSRMATKCHGEALEILKVGEELTRGNPGDESQRQTRPNLFRLISMCYREANHLRTAILWMTKHFEYMVSIGKPLDIAEAHLGMCGMLSATKRHGEALSHAYQARRIVRETLADVKSNDSGQAEYEILVMACRNLAIELEQINEDSMAVYCYDEAVEIAESHFGPEDPFTRETKRYRKKGRMNIVHRQSQLRNLNKAAWDSANIQFGVSERRVVHKVLQSLQDDFRGHPPPTLEASIAGDLVQVEHGADVGIEEPTSKEPRRAPTSSARVRGSAVGMDSTNTKLTDVVRYCISMDGPLERDWLKQAVKDLRYVSADNHMKAVLPENTGERYSVIVEVEGNVLSNRMLKELHLFLRRATSVPQLRHVALGVREDDFVCVMESSKAGGYQALRDLLDISSPAVVVKGLAITEVTNESRAPQFILVQGTIAGARRLESQINLQMSPVVCGRRVTKTWIGTDPVGLIPLAVERSMGPDGEYFTSVLGKTNLFRSEAPPKEENEEGEDEENHALNDKASLSSFPSGHRRPSTEQLPSYTSSASASSVKQSRRGSISRRQSSNDHGQVEKRKMSADARLRRPSVILSRKSPLSDGMAALLREDERQVPVDQATKDDSHKPRKTGWQRYKEVMKKTGGSSIMRILANLRGTLGSLTITVYEAKDLKGLYDVHAPFVIVALDYYRRSMTQPCFDNAHAENPRFMEHFTWNVENKDATVVNFQVISSTFSWKHPEVLGSAEVPLRDLQFGESVDMWLDLIRKGPPYDADAKLHVGLKIEKAVVKENAKTVSDEQIAKFGKQRLSDRYFRDIRSG